MTGDLIKHFRLRHGLSQVRMANLVDVPASRVAVWERGEGEPDAKTLHRFAALVANAPQQLMHSLQRSVAGCPLARALSRGVDLTLQAVSAPAVEKRPSIVEMTGRKLAPLAQGVLATMLDDGALQRAVAKGEVAGIVSTTRSVLETPEAKSIATWRTTITYFFHDGDIYSDAIGIPVGNSEVLGYTPVMLEEVGSDLFGDQGRLFEALSLTRGAARPAPRAAG